MDWLAALDKYGLPYVVIVALAWDNLRLRKRNDAITDRERDGYGNALTTIERVGVALQSLTELLKERRDRGKE